MLTIHRSERADALVDALVAVVAEPLPDAFTPEIVAVPTRGVERWLTHRLGATLGATPGRADGVCANVEFPFPGRLVGDVLAVATGVDRAEDPWRPERLVWPLLDVIDEHVGEPWLGLLASHLGRAGEGDPDELRQSRRFATARHLADLFDGYGIYRPDMVLGWVDAGPGAPAPGIPHDAQWQPRLWHALRERVAARRWVSQRSTPRVGTATISGAKASGSGSATTATRASTRASARSLRWMVSTAPLRIASV